MSKNHNDSISYTFQGGSPWHNQGVIKNQLILSRLQNIQQLLKQTLAVNIQNEKMLQKQEIKINNLECKISLLINQKAKQSLCSATKLSDSLKTKKKSKSFCKNIIKTIELKEKLLQQQIGTIMKQQRLHKEKKAPLKFFLSQFDHQPNFTN